MNKRRILRIGEVVKQRHHGIIVVLEDIHDPHNAAAILRTCDALGIQNVWFVFNKETPYDPKKIGKASSATANKWLDFTIFTSMFQCIHTLKQQGYTIVTTALTEQSENLLDTTFTEEKIAVIVGNEKSGVSKTAIVNADRVIRIPMRGFVQSLNVSVATAIVLWEITKQRLALR